MTAKTLPSGTGIVSSYSYDTADRLTGIAHVKDGTTAIASVAYTLDDVGNDFLWPLKTPAVWR